MNSREKMHDFFDVSEAYNTKRYSQVLELVKKKSINSVLDIGPGPRSIVENITVDKKYAIEINKKFVDILREKNITCVQKDIQDGFCLDDTMKFDLIFCLEIIEHLYHLDKFFNSIQAVLNRDGHVVITVPNDVGFFTRRILVLFHGSIFGSRTFDPYKEQHIRFFTIEALRLVLEGQGFSIVEIRGLNSSLPNGKRGFVEYCAGLLSLQRWFPNLFSTHFAAVVMKSNG